MKKIRKYILTAAGGFMSLYRGDPTIQDSPQVRSHPGIYFFSKRNAYRAKGYSRAVHDNSMVGAVRELKVPINIIKRLAELGSTKVYNKLLPNEDDRSGKLTRGVMPSKELVAALRQHGYTGYRWQKPDGGPVEYFLLPEAIAGLKYEPLGDSNAKI